MATQLLVKESTTRVWTNPLNLVANMLDCDIVYIYPVPLHQQDVTQGQFLSEVLSSSSSHTVGTDFPDSPSLINHPYRLPLSAGLLVYILYPYRAVVGIFFLVAQHWHVHMKESTRECHWWFCSCFSRSVLHPLFVLLGWL